MYWNYRIVRRERLLPSGRKKRYDYAIHEAYYDEEDRVRFITQDPVNFGADFCETEQEAIDEIIRGLEYALKDVKNQDIIDFHFVGKKTMTEKEYLLLEDFLCEAYDYDAFDDRVMRTPERYPCPENAIGFVLGASIDIEEEDAKGDSVLTPEYQELEEFIQVEAKADAWVGCL